MNKNKKFFIIILFIIIIAIIITLILKILNKNNNSDDDNSNYTEKNYSNNIKLPDLKMISEKDDSILYDYLNGSIGLNSENYSDKIINDCSNYFALLFNDESLNNNIIWISYYKSDSIFPSLGSNIKQYNISDQLIESLEKSINSINNNNLFEFNYNNENYKIILIYTYDNINGNLLKCDQNGYFSGIDLVDKLDDFNIYGNEYSIIETQGWPTKWLRRCSNNERIQNKYSINSDFWDRHNLFSLEQYKNKNGENVYIYCAGFNKFKITIGNGEISTLENNNGYISKTYYLKESELDLFKESLQ